MHWWWTPSLTPQSPGIKQLLLQWKQLLYPLCHSHAARTCVEGVLHPTSVKENQPTNLFLLHNITQDLATMSGPLRQKLKAALQQARNGYCGSVNRDWKSRVVKIALDHLTNPILECLVTYRIRHTSLAIIMLLFMMRCSSFWSLDQLNPDYLHANVSMYTQVTQKWLLSDKCRSYFRSWLDKTLWSCAIVIKD